MRYAQKSGFDGFDKLAHFDLFRVNLVCINIDLIPKLTYVLLVFATTNYNIGTF